MNRSKINKNKPLYLMLFIGLSGFLLFYLIPFFISLPNMFFSNKNGFEGLNIIIDLLHNEPFIRALKNTGLFLLLCLPQIIVIPLLLAMSLKKIGNNKKFFLLLLLLPMVIPSSSVVFFWKNMFSVNGFLNSFLQNFGVAPINWFNTQYDRIIFGLIFFWKFAGYNTVLFLGGLSSIPNEYYEYARIETNNTFYIFKNITIIYILPTVMVVLLLSIINSFKIFREIYLISGSYPSNSSYMVQHFLNNMFNSLNYSKLVSASTIVTILIGIAVLIFFKIQSKLTENIGE